MPFLVSHQMPPADWANRQKRHFRRYRDPKGSQSLDGYVGDAQVPTPIGNVLRKAIYGSALRAPVQGESCGTARVEPIPVAIQTPLRTKRKTPQARVKGNATPHSAPIRALEDVFAGSAGVTAACAKQGIKSCPWDIKQGECFDLVRRTNERRLIRRVKRKSCIGVMIATPCQTFSRVRRGKPPPLRSNRYIHGLPNLSASDFVKVRQGYRLAKLSIRVFKLRRSLGKKCIIENPATSMLWKLLSFQTLLAKRDVHSVITHFCQYGTPWFVGSPQK